MEAPAEADAGTRLASRLSGIHSPGRRRHL